MKFIIAIAIIMLPVMIASYSDNGWAKDCGESAIIELAIIADKAFGEIFHNNRTEILNYWSVFVEDLNQKLYTVDLVCLSVRVTSVTVLQSAEEQQLIGSKNDSGTISLNNVLLNYHKWIVDKLDSFPKFDAAMIVTALSLTPGDSETYYLKGICRKYNSVVAISDQGNWNVGDAAHELGHLLGANHDDRFRYCYEEGYIMGDRVGPNQFYFSRCSVMEILSNLWTRNTDCLRETNRSEQNILEPFRQIAPSMEVQCKRHLKSGDAVVSNTSSCQLLSCTLPESGKETLDFIPVDRSPCNMVTEIGTCFRGFCLPYLIEAQVDIVDLNEAMCVEADQVVSEAKACSFDSEDTFFIASTPSDKNVHLVIWVYNWYGQGEKRVKNQIGCLGVTEDRLPWFILPCPENLSLEFQWNFKDLESVGKIQNVSTASSNNSVGYFDKASGEIRFWKQEDKKLEEKEVENQELKQKLYHSVLIFCIGISLALLIFSCLRFRRSKYNNLRVIYSQT